MKRLSDDADVDRKRSREVPSNLENSNINKLQATEVLPAPHPADTQYDLSIENSIEKVEEVKSCQNADTGHSIKNGQNKSLVDLTGAEEDPQLQQAVFDSLQTATNVTEIDPLTRKRDENIPVGLKNVGNTCYVNSLLQTYFMLPQLRQLIFQIHADDKEGDDAKSKQVKKFVRELQLLFGRMILANVKWVDPSNLLNSIVNENGKSLLSIGRQEDLGEFMNLFADWMERGLKLHSDEIQEQKDIMKEMFQFEAIDLLTANEEDGEPIESSTKHVHSFLMLDVKYKDFYYELDEALVDLLDWKTPKEFVTIAQKHTWLTCVPPVVMFQEGRATFDRATNRTTKNRTPMTFKKDIDLARYMHENKESTTEKRAIVKRYRAELEEVQKKIQKSQESFPWQTFFPLAIKYYQDGLDPDIPSPGEPFLDTLKSQFSYHQKKLSDLEKQVNTLREQIEQTYADLTGKPYTLFAVWIHSGPTTGSGHYWTYIRNCQLDTWFKFNDMQVDCVEETEVWRHAIGGEDSNVSAYFLIYISKEFASTYGGDANGEYLVPPFVYNQVCKENQEFTALLEKRIKESTTESGVDKFCRLYHESQNGAEKIQSSYYDPRIASFGAWLRSLDLKEEDFQGMLVTHLWRQCLSEKELGEHISTSSVEFNEVKKKLFHPMFTKQVPSTSEIDEKEKEEKAQQCLMLGTNATDPGKKIYFDSYRFFRIIYQYLVEGFKNLEAKNYVQVLQYFYEAHRLGASFTIPVSLPDIKSILRITLIVILEVSIQDIRNDQSLDMNSMPHSKKNISSIVSLVTLVFTLIQNVFPNETEDSWISDCRHKLVHAAMEMTKISEILDPTVEDLVSSSLLEGKPVDPPSIPLSLPELSEECYADLAKQYAELFAKFYEEYKNYITNFKLKNCEFPDEIVTMQVEEESQTQEDNNSN